MPAIIHLSDIWEHTLTEILNHDPKSEVGIIVRAWVKHTSLLTYDLNDFTPSGILYYFKDKADSEVALIMPNTPGKGLTTSGDTFNISYSNLNMIIMMMSLIILSMKATGCCKQEENI